MIVKNILSIFILSTVLVLISGCATPVHMSKSVDQSAKDRAAQEIKTAKNWAPRYISDEEAEKKVLEIYRNLLPAATNICRQLGEDECGWDIRYSTDEGVNAFATGESVVVIQKGILRYAENDDEVAMVIAHELSHHAANHISETVQNMQTGQIIGGILMGVLAGVAHSKSNYYGSYQRNQINNAVDSGMKIGGAIGKLSYSKDQENEADYIGLHILYSGGYDPTKARKIWIKLAQLGKTEHGERHSFNTHPDPSTRLARFDQTILDIEKNAGKFGIESRKTSYTLKTPKSSPSTTPQKIAGTRKTQIEKPRINTASKKNNSSKYSYSQQFNSKKEKRKQGKYSFVIGRLAKAQGCELDGAGEFLGGKKSDTRYRVYCKNQQVMNFTCDWSNCSYIQE